MKRTNYQTVVTAHTTYCEYRRIWVDEDGKRFIKYGGEWVCIEGTPCIDFISEVE